MKAINTPRVPARRGDPDVALPQLAELVARGLRSGASLNMSLRTAAREVSPALAPSLSVALGALDRGTGAAGACRAWADRRPTAGRNMFAAVVDLTSQLGGRSAQSFDALASALRQQSYAQREARALASQARLSALVIGLLPLAMLAVVALADPTAVIASLAAPISRWSLAAGLLCQSGGWLWIRRLMRWTR